MHYYYCLVRGGRKLQSKQLTVHIWLIEPWKTREISLQMCLNFLISWITCSMCIRTDAIVWLSVTSSLVSCSLPCKNADIFNETPNGFSTFSTVKPLPTINESDLCHRSFYDIPHCCTIFTSEIDWSWNSLINVTLPDGTMPSKPLYVWK